MLLTRADEMREFRTNGELSDICIIVDKREFHLHKFPLFLNSEFFRALCRCGMMDQNTVILNEFPGGAKTFSLIADYCYGLSIDINSSNVAQLRCAAEFLQMTSHGNLASETSAALIRILRSQPTTVSHIIEIISSASKLGVIASQTNIISLCFDALFIHMKKGNFLESLSEVLMDLPFEWFVGFIVGARDASVAIPTIIRLAGKYLERIVRAHKVCITEYLEHRGPQHEVYTTEKNGNVLTVHDIGKIMDAILVEFPDNTSLSKVIDGELLCLLFRLAVQLECKCEGILLTAISNNFSEIPREIFVTMPTASVVSIAEHSLQNNTLSPTLLCNTVDKYLWERAKLKNITLEEFETVVRTIPKQYRPQHDSVLLIAEVLFSNTRVSEETKLNTLDIIDVYRLHEETLRQISERNVIPSKFIVSSALAVSSRLRNELTEAKLKLAEKDEAIREVHAGINDVIKGQWQYNDITLNVTPKDTTNSRVQFAKVFARNTSKELSMEHEVYDGKLTLCVRSCRGTSTQTFLFDPFNDQLVEITRSKHDNLMVGENYQKKKQTKSYWPFTDVIAS